MSNEPAEQLPGFPRALPHGLREAADQRLRPGLRPRPLLFTSTEKINRRKDDDLDRQADHKKLLMGCWLKPKKTEVRGRTANEIKQVTRGEIRDIHHHVDDGKRHGTLRGG